MGLGASLSLANVELTGGSAARGAAVFNDGGYLALEGCLLSNHSASERGGAIFSQQGGTVAVENTTLAGCSADGEGGAIFISRPRPPPPIHRALLGRLTTALGGSARKPPPPREENRALISLSRVIFADNYAPVMSWCG